MDINERIIKLEENVKSNQHRLNEHDKKIEDLHSLTCSVKELAVETKLMREDVNKMDNRLNALEEKPGKNWDSLTKIVLTRNCYSCSGLFFSKVGIVKGRSVL